jgi:uncharacterized protein YneF (UPF0154 family)
MVKKWLDGNPRLTATELQKLFQAEGIEVSLTTVKRYRLAAKIESE